MRIIVLSMDATEDSVFHKRQSGMFTGFWPSLAVIVCGANRNGQVFPITNLR